jgi:hypothetical protein
MNPIDLLVQPVDHEYTEEEEALILHHLALAYRMDERAATKPEIKRLVEKVRQQMARDGTAGLAQAGDSPFGPHRPDE